MVIPAVDNFIELVSPLCPKSTHSKSDFEPFIQRMEMGDEMNVSSKQIITEVNLKSMHKCDTFISFQFLKLTTCRYYEPLVANP